jgi:hypothetical protein
MYVYRRYQYEEARTGKQEPTVLSHYLSIMRHDPTARRITPKTRNSESCKVPIKNQLGTDVKPQYCIPICRGPAVGLTNI